MRYIKSCVLKFDNKYSSCEINIVDFVKYCLDKSIENYEYYDGEKSILINFKTIAKFSKKELSSKLKCKFEIFVKEYKYYYFTGKRFMPYNSSIEEITLSTNTNELPKNAFSWCKNIKIINGLDKVLTFGDKCLMNTSISVICLNEKVDELPYKFCYGCKNLLYINTNKIKKFGTYCFAYSGIVDINVYSTNKISFGMFAGCKKLENIYNIYNIRIVESNAFINCYKLDIKAEYFEDTTMFCKGWITSLKTTSF